jgi:hypothetical protein
VACDDYFFTGLSVTPVPISSLLFHHSASLARLKMLRWWGYLIFLFPSLFVGFINCHTLNEYNVGALFNLNNFDGTMDLSGVQAKEAILMAIREINNKSDGLYDDILPNITFKLATEHPNILFSTSTVAANLIRTSFNGNGIRACIGPGTNAAIAGQNRLSNSSLILSSPICNSSFLSLFLSGSATILREKGVFQIGYGGQDDAYGVKETFPSFVRLNPASGIHARVMATFIYKYFRYERVAIIHSYNVYGYYVHLKFLQSIQEMGYTNTLVFTDYGTKDYVDLITQVKKSGATIFMLLYSPVTWAVPMLKEGWKQGLFQEGTQIFAIEDMTTPQTWQLLSNAYCKKYGITDTYIEAYQDYELSLEDIASLMKGFIGLRVMIDKTEPLARSFIDRWKQQMNTNYSPLTSSCNNITDDNGKYLHQAYDQQTNQYVCRGINFTASLDDGSDIFPSAFFAYDSILLLARSLHYFLTSTTRSITSQNDITYLDLQEVLNQFTSVGVTGSYSQSLTYELRSDNERKTDLSFSIFTFDSNHFLISSQSLTKETYEGIPLPSSLGLRYTGKLHSSQLFQSCQQSNIISNLCSLQDYDPHIFNCSCSNFIYDTPHNSLPHDLPSLQTKQMSLIQKIILIIFSILLFLIIILTIFLLYYYRKCRYVKITQPELSLITFLGGLCICIAAFITSFDLIEGSCKMIDIFCHLGYILLFSPLITKTWRLYLIIGSNSLKKIHITMRQTLLVVAIFVSITIILITIIEFHRPQRDYDYEMITDTPQERVRSKYCPAGRDVFVILLFTYESLVIILGGVLCYLTRNLPSGISDSSQVANGMPPLFPPPLVPSSSCSLLLLLFLSLSLPSLSLAIFGIIAVSILGVSLTQLTKMHHQDTLFVSVLLVLGGAIRALHVLYRSLTLKLLEVGPFLPSSLQSSLTSSVRVMI